MSDTAVRLEPISVLGTGAWTPYGTGSVVTALTDGNPATYVGPSSTGPPTSTMILTYGPTSLSALDQLHSVQVVVDTVVPDADTAIALVFRLFSADGAHRLSDQRLTVTHGDSTSVYTLAPFRGWTDGTAFTPADLAGFKVHVFAEPVSTFNALTMSHLRVFEIALQVNFNQPPQVSVDALSAEPWAASHNPRQVFAYADPEGDEQERFQTRVYELPAGGWPAPTGADDLIAALEAAAVQPVASAELITPLTALPRVLLDPGGEFRRFVRAADVDSGGRFGHWSYRTFHLAGGTSGLSRPPSIVAVAHPGSASVTLSLTNTQGAAAPSANLVYSYQVQRSDDGGVTWNDVIGSPFLDTGPPPSAIYPYGTGGTTTLVDRFAPREAPLRYRVRSISLTSGETDGLTTSAWVAIADPVTLAYDGNSWLQAVAHPELDMALCHSDLLFDAHTDEDVAIFTAEGRAEAIILGGTVHLRQFNAVNFTLLDQAEWVNFKALRDLRGRLFLRTIFGEGPLVDVWVRLGPVLNETLVGPVEVPSLAQRRSVACSAIEVTAP